MKLQIDETATIRVSFSGPRSLNYRQIERDKISNLARFLYMKNKKDVCPLQLNLEEQSNIARHRQPSHI